MNYNGNPNKALCDSGFNIANRIIGRFETIMSAA